MEANQPNETPEQSAPEPPSNKPVLTKAFGSVICGLISIPSCMLLGVPALIFGGLAIWLGRYVHKNFRGSTASEIANLYAWIGIALGTIGVILGVIFILMTILGGIQQA